MKALEVRGDLDFDYVIRAEIEDINRRRRQLGRAEHTSDIGYSDERQTLDVVGLALSGGGIRSASFCLGVLQALNHHGVFRNIDYLSTVSGGGYIGSSLSATMTATGGEFAYGGGSATAGESPPEEISDTASVSHIRNYSNYLIPFGPRDVMSALAIVVRGLAASLGQVLVIVLLAAGVTAAVNPDRASLLTPGLFHWDLKWLPSGQFGITAGLALLVPVIFLGWALYRSALKPERLSEFRTRWPAYAAGYLVILAIVAFFEAQPFVIEGMFQIADAKAIAAETNAKAAPGGLFYGLVASWVEWLALITAPIVALATVLRKSLGDIIAASSATTRFRTQLAGILAHAVVWVAGAAVPLLIWVGYLYLSYWAIPNDPTLDVPAVECTQAGASGTFDLGGGVAPTGGFEAAFILDESAACKASPAYVVGREPFAHTPRWIAVPAGVLDDSVIGGPYEPVPAPYLLYVFVGIVLLIVLLLLKPNANSLHRLYRDRLSKTFLFDPGKTADGGPVAGHRDLAPLDTMKLSALDPAHAPYQLINAALNIQGSDFANRRGRNADFFLFSRRYVGGPATGYAETSQMEKRSPDLDLATALAISGAAASSNMGSKSIRALTATLALLNVRLGFWLANPFFAYRGEEGDTQSERPRRVWSYLLSEITGRLSEDRDVVYVTDGGHIENLGVYELLRRRCKLIVAIDAEADPEMRFASLVTLQRYARIDLGVRIKIPWPGIADVTRAWMGVGGGDKPKSECKATCGPHVVVGRIDYGAGRVGHLVYIKASLTGDENDYVRDYARRHGRFPHETTGDQFFDEEQFEVYRALGFHATFGFLEGRDDVLVDARIVAPAGSPPPAADQLSVCLKANDKALKPIRDRLGLATAT